MNSSRLLSLFCGIALSAAVTPANAAFLFNGPAALDVDTNPGTQVVLNVGAGFGTITDLNIAINIVGGHMEDFDLFLTSPLGTTVQIRKDDATPSLTHMDFFDVVFDDEAANPNSALAPSNGLGTFQPFLPLSAFDGQSLLGNWTLTIFDDYVPGEGNDLISWSIFGDNDVAEVPEPASLALFGIGGLGLIAARKRRRAA